MLTVCIGWDPHEIIAWHVLAHSIMRRASRPVTIKPIMLSQIALIATGPARKFLPDGRNAHLIQEGVNWWVSLLMEYWDLQNLNNQGNGFISIWTPKQEQP